MRKLNGGTLLGFIALFVALSGGAYAAISLPRNSVTTKQVKDHSLLKRDFRAGQLPRGARGEPGLDGAPGPQGPVGPTNMSALTRVNGPRIGLCPVGNGCATASSAATCPSGTRVVSGGHSDFTGETWGEFSLPSEDRSAWLVGVSNGSDFSQGYVQAVALCATTGSAVAARTRGITAATRREVAGAESRLRALAHRSGCHGAHSCPSDHGTYRWRGLRCWKAGADDKPSSARTRVTYAGLRYYCKH